jgi:hypothetical protein
MSTVELTRETDGPGLLQVLADHGLKGELVGEEAHVVVRVEDCDDEQLVHAIEDWLWSRQLQLVPVRIDDCTYAVLPPAA